MSIFKIYACGGAAANIAKQLLNKKIGAVTMATPEVVFVDTSDANYRVGYEKESTYVLPNVSGSGKVRSENSEVIQRGIGELVKIHEGGDFNVVLFSASGGSGSVIGPLLAAELLGSDLPTVTLVLGTVESAQAVKNTLNTLKSLDGLSRKRKLPISMFYRLQLPTDPEQEINELFISTIARLALVTSQRNDDLDIRDIHNLIFYPNITGGNPALLALDFLFSNEDLEDLSVSNVITLVDILPNRQSPVTTGTPLYRTVGYAAIEDKVTAFTTPDLISMYLTELNRYGKELNELLDSIQSNSAFDDAELDDDGMCL